MDSFLIMQWWGLSLQNMVTHEGQLLDWFHDYVCGILIFILFLVGCILANLCLSGWVLKGLVEASFLELIWTIFPIVILFFVGLPSMLILYQHEVEMESDLTVKVVGHQWYWSYDYSGLSNVEFDSFMLPLNEIGLGDFRLLEVDNRVVLPVNSVVRFAVCSADVLHSWALPSMGIKVDANPGRLNFVFANASQVGLYYGQCSEICGANHSFMPICLEISSPLMFGYWLSLF